MPREVVEEWVRAGIAQLGIHDILDTVVAQAVHVRLLKATDDQEGTRGHLIREFDMLKKLELFKSFFENTFILSKHLL